MIEGHLYVEGEQLFINVRGVKHRVSEESPMEIRLGGVWIPGHFAVNRYGNVATPVFYDGTVVVGIIDGLPARVQSL